MKSIKKIIFLKSLTAIFCIGLFAFNLENNYISNEKHSKLLLKPIDGLNNEQTDIFMLGISFFNPDYAIGKFQSKQTYYKI